MRLIVGKYIYGVTANGVYRLRVGGKRWRRR